MAMYAEQILCGDKSFYHQDKNGWLKWCTENRSRLFSEFLKRVESGESVQPFFGDWNDFEGRSDAGYYLGCEMIKSMAEKYSLSELANAELSEVKLNLKRLSQVLSK